MDVPLIPDFNDYKARNKWIVDHAQYWTIIRPRPWPRERQEAFTYKEALERASIILSRAPDARLLIYAVAGGHGALAATVSSNGVRRHE